MPRFVVLEHDWPERHWDFLLEAGGVLRAWRLLEEPASGKAVAAEPNFPHRLVYLDYEGPVSGDRGTVTRWDGGEFEWLEDAAERVAVELRGARLAGGASWVEAEGVWRFGQMNLGEPAPSGAG